MQFIQKGFLEFSKYSKIKKWQYLPLDQVVQGLFPQHDQWAQRDLHHPGDSTINSH